MPVKFSLLYDSCIDRKGIKKNVQTHDLNDGNLNLVVKDSNPRLLHQSYIIPAVRPVF